MSVDPRALGPDEVFVEGEVVPRPATTTELAALIERLRCAGNDIESQFSDPARRARLAPEEYGLWRHRARAALTGVRASQMRAKQWLRDLVAAQSAARDWPLLVRAHRLLDGLAAGGVDVTDEGRALAAAIRARLRRRDDAATDATDAAPTAD